jgi:hypothetical protein
MKIILVDKSRCILIPGYGVEEVDEDKVEQGQHRHLHHHNILFYKFSPYNL